MRARSSKPLIDVTGIVLFLCTIFIFELLTFGSGQWSDPILGFNLRKFVFGAILALSVIANLNQRYPTTETACVVFGTAFLVLIWVLLLPTFYSTRLDYAIRDALPLVGILAVIPLKILLTDDIWNRGRLIFGASILVTALLQIMYYIVGMTSQELVLLMVVIHRSLLDPLSLDPENAVFASTVDEITRVNWPGTSMLLLGLYIFCTTRRSEMNSVLRLLAISIMLISLYAAQTRALQIASLMLLSIHYFFRRFSPTRIRPIHIFSTLLCCTLLTIPILMSLDPQTLELIGISRGGSDEDRYQQILPLINSWLNHPFFGQGFGASATLIRSEDAPFSYELFVLSLLMKVGIFGFLLLLLILGQLTYSAIKIHRKIDSKESAWLLSLVVSITFIGNTNPYLTSLLGTLTVIFVLLELQFRICNTRYNHPKIIPRYFTPTHLIPFSPN